MGLLRKIQVLMGALAHKPFEPRRDKAEAEVESSSPAGGSREADALQAGQAGEADLSPPSPTGLDDQRVADLIAREQRRENG